MLYKQIELFNIETDEWDIIPVNSIQNQCIPEDTPIIREVIVKLTYEDVRDFNLKYSGLLKIKGMCLRGEENMRFPIKIYKIFSSPQRGSIIITLVGPFDWDIFNEAIEFPSPKIFIGEPCNRFELMDIE